MDLRPRQILIACLPGGLLLVLMWLAWPVAVDDAFISFRHAYNWVAHGVLSFDPSGPRIEGYSNFAQVAFAAILLHLGADPLPIVKLLGAISALACLPLVYLLARGIGAAHPFAVLGSLLLATSSGLAFWSVSGLETGLVTLLVTLGVLLFLPRRRGLDLLGSAVFALAALTRVEAPILFGAVALQRLFVERLEGRGARELIRANWPWLGLFLAIYAPYWLWRWNYFGHLFPNSIYFKRATTLGGVAASHTASFLESAWPLLLLAGASLLARDRLRLAPLLVVAAALGIFANAQVLVLEDVSTMGFYDRYFVPVLPCLLASAMLGLTTLWQRAGPRRALRSAVIVAAALLVGLWVTQPEANALHLAGRSRSYPRAVAARNLPTAAYLQQRFGSAGSVVAGDVGRLGNGFTGIVYDLFGLNSYDFTLRFHADVERYVRDLVHREPDAIVVCWDDESGQACHHAEAVLMQVPAFRAHYQLVRRFGRDTVPRAHFVVYERMGPGVASAQAGRAADAPAPARGRSQLSDPGPP